MSGIDNQMKHLKKKQTNKHFLSESTGYNRGEIHKQKQISKLLVNVSNKREREKLAEEGGNECLAGAGSRSRQV